MELTKPKISKYARDLGLSDIRFADAKELVYVPSLADSCSCLDSFKPTCVIVLFANYLPAKAAPKGNISLSPYYIASNLSYHAGKKITAYIQQHGANASFCTHILAKAAAIKTGGFIGDNGFYYHERYGSYVCIETILTDALQSEDYSQNIKNSKKECAHCGRCAAACPSDAVENIENCLKSHLYKTIPKALRQDVYQLFGCEKCQRACPLNSSELCSKTPMYPLEGLINGDFTKELKEIAGSNLVRKNRVISQGVIYAANKKEYNLTEMINELSKSSQEPVRTHALWAYEKLKSSKGSE